MGKCGMSTDQYIYVGLAIYAAVCCTVGVLYQCLPDRLAARPTPPLVESTVVIEPQPYRAVV